MFLSVGRVPLTEQGKPDRAAIRRLAPSDAPSTAGHHAPAGYSADISGLPQGIRVGA